MAKAHLWFLALTVTLFNKSQCTKFSSSHLLINDCSDYWREVLAAGNRTLNFDSSHCVEDKETESTILEDLKLRSNDEERLLLVTNSVESCVQAMQEGIEVFSIEQSVDLNQYGLDPDQVLFVSFEPDNEHGAKQVGEELCRIAGSLDHKIVGVYPPEDHAHLDVRVDAALEQFVKKCPNADYEVIKYVRGDFSRETAYSIFQSLFLIDSTITTIIAADDESAIGVIQAAQETLSNSQLSSLYISGFEFSSSAVSYLESKQMFATVDERMKSVDSGMWNVMNTLKNKLEEKTSINSTTSLQLFLNHNSTAFKIETWGIFSDFPGYITNKLEYVYQPSVRAVPDGGSGPTTVHVGIQDLEVNLLDIAGGSFDADFWIRLEWVDSRLAWEDQQYPGVIQWDTTNLWTPDLYFKNIQTSETDHLIYLSKGTIDASGNVEVSAKIQGTFACQMSVAAYPYDRHLCPIQIGVAEMTEEVILNPSFGTNVADAPEGYSVAARETIVGEDDNSPTGFSTSLVKFYYYFEHDPSFVVNSYILLGWALNLLAFAQFWIPIQDGFMDRSGIAITTILATGVLLTEAKVSQVTTWQDLFYSISLAFQCASFITSVLVSRRSQFSRCHGIGNYREALSVKLDILNSRSVYEKAFFFIWGGDATPWEDRISQRTMVPAFLVIMTFLPFIDLDSDNVDSHPLSGAQCPLFIGSLTIIINYVVISVAYFCQLKFGSSKPKPIDPSASDAHSIGLRSNTEKR